MKKILDWMFYDSSFAGYRTEIFERKAGDGLHLTAISCDNKLQDFDIENIGIKIPKWSITDTRMSAMFNHELEILGKYLTEIVLNNKFSY